MANQAMRSDADAAASQPEYVEGAAEKGSSACGKGGRTDKHKGKEEMKRQKQEQEEEKIETGIEEDIGWA